MFLFAGPCYLLLGDACNVSLLYIFVQLQYGSVYQTRAYSVCTMKDVLLLDGVETTGKGDDVMFWVCV